MIFQPGDDIRHMNGDIGRITEITATGDVCATFKCGKSKTTFRGRYDRDWFEKYPNGLVKIEGEPT